MVPSFASASAPNASCQETLPTTPIQFDGIAMFLISSLEKFVAAFKDPYYINVIEPDERELIDKDGVGKGVVASFSGTMLPIIDMGKSFIGEKGEKERKIWEEWERRGQP